VTAGAPPFRPLAGIRVLDLTSSLAGPYATQILAALGADVLKVERPGAGDEARHWGPPFWRGASVVFFAANAGKRSLALDLKRPEGLEALLRLADRADVFVESLRPGAAARLGLGPDAVRERNERLVYLSIGAFGRRGPLRDRAGYDPLIQAASGIMSLTGEARGRPVRAGVSLVDLGTATWAALAIVAALHERAATGRGRVVDLSLYEAALALLPYQLADNVATGATPPRAGSAFALIVPYQVFAASDRELMIAAANDRLFAALCDVLELSELAADPRFRTNPLRVEHREELVRILGRRLAERPAAFWLAALQRAGVPATPIHDLAEVAAHEQTRALGMLQSLDGLATVAPPLSVDGRRVLHGSRPPLLGEHSAEALAEAGYGEDEVRELAAAGVVSLAGKGPER
jgi:crotonobetainyl-CoA:carnitine CoA-transferase CaiB-like acyl-CoA transferase